MQLDYPSAKWQIASFEWLIRTGGGYEKFKATPVISPTEKHFDEAMFTGADMAPRVFRRIKELLGMDDGEWPCLLQEFEDGDPFDNVLEDLPHSRSKKSDPKGFFEFDRETKEVTISYGKSLLKDPARLITVLVHELSHYYLRKIESDPPGGEEAHEYLTDLACVYKGFGVFLSYSAFQFQKFSSSFTQGWSSNKLGYLNKFEISNAISLFLLLQDKELPEVKEYLDASAIQFCEIGFRSNQDRFSPEIAKIKGKYYLT